ncbi:hypothetical protein GW17_00023261 [Ensete ventricosum]|nr:hypothetical protein GW17_00023261 [Ensete ventricosum]RZR78547.1 hypothetical protein BHM03_00003962 [Ensete ventricosum]
MPATTVESRCTRHYSSPPLYIKHRCHLPQPLHRITCAIAPSSATASPASRSSLLLLPIDSRHHWLPISSPAATSATLDAHTATAFADHPLRLLSRLLFILSFCCS